MLVFVIGAIAVFTFLSELLKEKKKVEVSVSASAKQTYLDHCAVCHGREGAGTAQAKGLRGRQLDPAYVRRMIQSGNTVMPKFNFISGAALDELAEYVHNLK